MVEELVVNDFLDERRGGYCSNLSLRQQEKIILGISSKLRRGPKVVSTFEEWHELDINNKLKNNDIVIVQNTFEIIQCARNGLLFADAKERGIVFLFFVNDEIKNYVLNEKWMDFLQEAYLIPYPLFREKDEPVPKSGMSIITLKFFFIVVSFFLLLKLLSFLFLRFQIKLDREVISSCSAVLSFLILSCLYIYANHRINIKRNSHIFWFLIALALGFMDTALGRSFYEIAKQIYEFVYHLF